MTTMVQQVQERPERYVPRTRNIYLVEVDALTQVLVGRGHALLAKRIRQLVREHEEACLARPNPTQPTVCRIDPGPLHGHALTDALRAIRKVVAA
jgi:hypothetical protein